jgi:hypothetical protein
MKTLWFSQAVQKVAIRYFHPLNIFLRIAQSFARQIREWGTLTGTLEKYFRPVAFTIIALVIGKCAVNHTAINFPETEEYPILRGCFIYPIYLWAYMVHGLRGEQLPSSLVIWSMDGVMVFTFLVAMVFLPVFVYVGGSVTATYIAAKIFAAMLTNIGGSMVVSLLLGGLLFYFDRLERKKKGLIANHL